MEEVAKAVGGGYCWVQMPLKLALGVRETVAGHRLGTLEGGVWHKAPVSDCLPLAAPIGLSPLLILTLCGPERVLVVSTEPLDDLSCLTTPGVGRPRDRLLPVPLTRCIQMHTPSPCGGLPTPALTCARRSVRWMGGGGAPPGPPVSSPSQRVTVPPCPMGNGCQMPPPPPQ